MVFKKGAFHLAPRPLEIVRAVADLVSETGSHPEIINLPNTTEREKELLSLGQLLVGILHDNRSRLRFLAPVCPDYSQESSDTFYQTIGDGISPQAYAAMRAAQLIEQIFSRYGIRPQVEILVADTEDDIPEVMERCVDGDPQIYKNRCLASVQAIGEELNGTQGTKVTTFTLGLGERFRQIQYEYENVIKRLRGENSVFDREVRKLGDLRRERHSKILGRREVDYELTIRYMAQYAALGTLARRAEEPTILLNYSTPNLPFYNAAVFRDPAFSLSTDDLRVVPILETVIRGKL
ncbi:MAG: hypothetical protein Q7S60_04605 [bacterium]|nr:hypothetical protein [bacterium]